MRLALLLSIVALVAVHALEYPAKEQYRLQRSFDGASWTDRASLTVTRSEASSPARLKVTPSPSHSIESSDIVSASLLMYRVAKADDVVAASLVTTVCALLRGFEAVSSTSIKLPEVVGIVVAEGVQISGLQLSPVSNTHHSSFAASECDTNVITLFRDVDASLTVNLIKSVVPKAVTTFDDAPITAGAPPPKKDENAGGDKKPAEEDNRSFFEKYWWYIVLFGVYTLVNGVLGQKKEAALAAGAK